MRIDTIIIMRSFVEAGRKILDKTERCDYYDALFDYGLDHIEPDLVGGGAIAMELVKPLLDSQYQKRMVQSANGKKGGRPKAETSQSSEELEDKDAKQKPKKANKTQLKPTKAKKSLIDNCELIIGNCELIIENHSKEWRDALNEFLAMRKQIGDPIRTQFAANKLVRRLEGMGDEQEQIKILNQSIEREWKGVFPLKDTPVVKDDLPFYDTSGNPETDETRLNEILSRRAS